MKVLIINPPMDVQGGPPRFISFGIAYIVQKLRSCGHDVELLDIDGNRFSKEEVTKFLEEKSYEIVGIGGLASIYGYLAWLIPEIKRLRPNIEIILGGAVASSLRDRCFKRFDIDYEVIGEGEETIIELLDQIKGNRNFSSVKGIGYRKNGNIIFTENRPLRKSLDDVPMLDDSLFPFATLLKNANGILQVHTQRGCPYECTFCFNCYRVVSRKIRYRPVKNVLDEIEYYTNKYDVKFVSLAGELIMLHKEWIIEFCKEKLRRKIKVRYRVTSRVNTVDEERLKWLKKSGCIVVMIGLESGSDDVLRVIKKSATAEQGKKAVALTKKYMHFIGISLMLNYVGETKETLRESVNYFKEIGIKPTVSYATPFPGTELYNMAIRKGCIKDEEEYLEKLYDASIFAYPTMNLTDIPDDEAFEVMAAAVDEINKYYFRRALFMPINYRTVLLRIKERGFIRASHAAFTRIKNGITQEFIRKKIIST